MTPDDSHESNAGLEGLLAAERAAPAPDAAAQARVAARVAATLAAGAGVTAATVTAATAEAATASVVTATSASSAVMAGKVFLGLAAVVLAGGTVVAVRLRSEPPPRVETPVSVAAPAERPVPAERPAPIDRPAPRVVVPARPAPPVAEPPAPVAQPRRVPRVLPVQAAPPAPASLEPAPPAVDAALIAERGLLAEARRALSTGDTAAALAALEAHRGAHANGRLGEERDALEISTLSAAGRRAEAAERAAVFLSRHPDSIFAASVKKYAALPNP
jgi:hypothetical protein